MKRTLVAAVTASLLLVGCGSGRGDDTDTVAQDPEPTTSAPTTEEPAVGTYPDFEPQSYRYTLGVSCFCAGVGTIDITVEDGAVVTAVYAAGGRGAEKGDPVPDFRRLTINDVIAAANDTEADSVIVDWPEGQDYPSSVMIDQIELAIDDEISYTVSDVVVS
ncbi:MAG: DUF6174 domain-containing protein [Nocardioides sp.]